MKTAGILSEIDLMCRSRVSRTHAFESSSDELSEISEAELNNERRVCCFCGSVHIKYTNSSPVKESIFIRAVIICISTDFKSAAIDDRERAHCLTKPNCGTFII